MRRRARLLIAGAVIGVSILSGWDAPAEASDLRAMPWSDPEATPLVFNVMAQPSAVKGSDGRLHLLYELQIGNAAPKAATLERVSVLDVASAAPIAGFDAAAVAQRFEIGADRERLANRLESAQFGVLFLHLAFNSPGDIPNAIAHQIDITLDPDEPSKAQKLSLRGAMTWPRTTPAVVLGAPLQGRNYLAGDGCCESVRHIRALLPLDGRFWLAQRFAIDWEQIDDQNRIFVGDPKDVNSYHIFGKTVFAVADGRVTSARNDLPEQVPHDPQGVTLETADGNHVLQDIGNNAYVLYAHMQKGSVLVEEGTMLHKGQPIGLVGNTGNSFAPHLHLHVVTAPYPLAGDGQPYVFERFALTGVDAAGTSDFDKGEAQGTPLAITPISPPSQHAAELPLDLTVVDWLNGGAR